MKKTLLILLSLLVIILCSCKNVDDVQEDVVNENIVQPDFVKEELDEKFGTEEIYIVKTYMVSPAEEIESYLDEGKIFTQVKHYQLSDGSWMTDEHNYKYKLELKGRLNNAAKDSTYVLLSNDDSITFDMAWKASGLSSNSEDYFKPEDAIIVAMG